jgi:hypothetical protein
MMAKQLFIFGLFATVCISASAQAILTGTVMDSVHKEPLPFANVALYKNGILKAGGQTDFDGIYRITEIDAGYYDVEFTYIGYEKFRHTWLQISAGQSLSLNAELKEDTIKKVVYCVFGKKIPIVKIDQMTQNCWIITNKLLDSLPIQFFCGLVAVPKDSNILSKASEMPIAEIENEVQTEFKMECAKVQLSPNPATTTLHLELKKEMESLHITNAQGQLMGNWTDLKQGTLQIEVNTWTNGLYFATFKQGNTVLTEKFSVMH